MTLTRHLALTLLFASLVAPACTGSASQNVDTKQAATPAAPTHHAKLQAPVDLTLEVTATTGELEATLTFTTTQDVRDATIQFVLPRDAKLLSGDLDTPFGGLAAGETRAVTLRLRAPTEGSHVLAAHVATQTASGRTLHAGTASRIGPDPRPETTRVKRLPDGTGVRLAK